MSAMVMKVSYHVDAPVEKVYDYFLSPDSGSGMGTEVLDSKVTKEGVGTYVHWRVKAGRIPVYEGFEIVTDVVPNKRITEKSSRALVGEWDYSFAVEGSGTKVTMVHRPRSFWALPPMSRAVDYTTTRLSQRYIEQVRKALEHKAVVPPQRKAPTKPRKAAATR